MGGLGFAELVIILFIVCSWPLGARAFYRRLRTGFGRVASVAILFVMWTSVIGLLALMGWGFYELFRMFFDWWFKRKGDK